MATTRRTSNGSQRAADADQRSTLPFDPLQLYLDGHVANLDVLLLGDPGTGKSATAKCLMARLLRSSADGSRDLRIVDPRGEYGALAEALGIRLVRLYPGGPHRLNPLDAGPSAAVVGPVAIAERRHAILAGLCETALGRDLTGPEHAGLATAVQALVPRSGGRPPVPADVVGLLAEPTAEMIARAGNEAVADGPFPWVNAVEPGELVGAAGQVGHVLARVLDRELRGCFDGPTTVGTRGGAGVVVDLSAFHGRRSTLRLAALAAFAGGETTVDRPLLAASAGQDSHTAPTSPQRYVVIDDSWVLMGDEHASAYLDSWRERAAFEDVACVLIAHRLSDLRRGSNDKALARRAEMFVRTFGTNLVFRQSVDDVELTRAALRLPDGEAAAITCLSRGQALWHIDLWRAGNLIGVPVQSEIGSDEWAFCDGPRTLTV
jgi:hypothetical protein